jgi:DNA-binding response OmpR family regulator
MARILLIDDDPSLREVLGLALEDAGHELLLAADGLLGMELLKRKPDLIISDINMPRLDGFSLCRKLRESGSTLPLLLLSSRDSEIDQALGLELGADDYVTKPFSSRVLLARVAALLRREALRAGAERAQPVRRVGHLEIDPDRLELRYRGRAVEATVTEFRMVEALAARPGMVLSRARLLEKMRGDDSVVVERLVDTYIRRMRRKFEETASADGESFDRIETIVGAGYRWREGAA